MNDLVRVSVRTLAEFATEGGDLSRAANAAERMQEGIRGHQAIQQTYPADWEREVPLSLDVELDGLALRVYGRADGLCRVSIPPVIEEIKTTERPIDAISADDVPAHWAQAELYGASLAAEVHCAHVELRLTYLNLSGGKVTFTRLFSEERLREKALQYARPYVQWLKALNGWRALSRPSMRALPFPFDRYRAGQREMAANVYVALRDSHRLLCEAPTGIGKTVAALYPALKALAEDKIDRVFFLSARTTGQRAAEIALNRMRQGGLIARSVTLSARDKVCLYPDSHCSPLSCPRARGYFDRRRAALYEALSMQSFAPDDVAHLAEKHSLCPFEFALDLAETADVVVCDYNYVFDPRVRLQRFFTGKSNAGLLIDEAHNLPSRARSMLSATLRERDVRDLRVRVGKESGRKHALYRALTTLLQAFKQLRASVEGETAQKELPATFVESVRDALPALGEHLSTPAAWGGDLADCFFALTDFARCADGYGEDFRTLLAPDGKALLDLTLWCVNPAPHLDKTMKRVHGAALFSATLSPMSFYRDVSGLSEQTGDALLSLPSPFPPENLLVLRAALPVRFRQREQSMPRLAELLCAFLTARTGNYLLFFPSYAYLRQAMDALAPLLPESVRVLVQNRDMDDEARAGFLAAFTPSPTSTLVGVCVLGGAFAEAVDLPGDLLTGAAIVGTGVPQIGLLNDALREVYGERFGSGYAYAYLYPGLAKALQAAGRVIRSEDDRGVVLLVDDRWAEAGYARLLPAHWNVESVRSTGQMSARLSEFWRDFSGK